MGFLLTQIAGELGSNIDFLICIAASGFQSLTYLGEVLICGVALIASCIHTFLLSCFNGISIVLAEFYFFLNDILNLKDEVCHFLIKGLNKCSNSMLMVLNFTLDGFWYVYSTIWNVMDTVFHVVGCIFMCINSFLHLVGQSFIVLVHAIIFDSGTLAIEILFGVKSLAMYIVTCTGQSLCNLVFSIGQLFKNMPFTSCLGLMVMIVLFVLSKMYFSQITRLIKLALLYTRLTAWELLRRTKGILNHFLTYVKNSRISSKSATSENVKPNQSNSEDLVRQLEMEREEKLCVVCRDQMRMFILLPCRHYCLCETCLLAILSRHGSCPICRHYVLDSWKIFC